MEPAGAQQGGVCRERSGDDSQSSFASRRFQSKSFMVMPPASELRLTGVTRRLVEVVKAAEGARRRPTRATQRMTMAMVGCTFVEIRQTTTLTT